MLGSRYTSIMLMQKNVSLRKHSTMRLGGEADYLTAVHDRHELVAALSWAGERSLPVRVIGQGSNIVWRDDGFNGLVIVNKISGFRVHAEDAHYSYVQIGAGEVWDEVVDRTVKLGLHGIEGLSLIPGTAGATPIQNVGAYGQEIADTLVSVEVYDTHHGSFITLQHSDCGFGYRTSRFKAKDNGRFIIVGLTLQLQHINPRPPFYPAVASYFREHKIQVITPLVYRQAVIAIRSAKLPDPRHVANNGSFFANPIITKAAFAPIHKKFPDIAHWPVGKTKVKLSAAWLIEHAGFKDFHDKSTGMTTWPKQPLVLVNEHAKTTNDLLMFKGKIVSGISKKFGVKLEQEPEILGGR